MPDLAIIFSGIIVGLIVIGVSINGIVGKVLDYKRSQNGNAPATLAATGQVSEIADRTDMIEDRVRVLERLATDRGQLLSDEIDALRDRAITQDRSSENA
uniref:hypothetical protein n=1 Tax=uncultured Erythrobacter sp. TaxID=263913 RepID=UPI00262123FA|nr:hypothetical protein [uncultured Erythrobacter sp.]